MPAGDRILINLPPNVLWLQPEPVYQRAQYGFDSGREVYLTHPSTPESLWPQIGRVSRKHSNLFCDDVDDALEDNGLIRLSCTFKGLMNGHGTKERIIPSCPVSIYSLPALSSGNKTRLVAPIPKPTVTRELVQTSAPTLEGVSLVAAGAFLPGLPSFTISFIPDPDEAQTLNYRRGWVLDSRTWEQPVPGMAAYLVKELYTYYWNLAV